MPNNEEKKYILDESPDYDFGDVRLLAPEFCPVSSFGPVEDSPDEDDDESPSPGGDYFDKGAGFRTFISSARLDKMLKRLKPRPPNCFQCDAELTGPFCFTCGIKYTGEKKVFRRI